MEKYIKRKNLSPEQYLMANKTMAIILIICHLLYVVVELVNKDDGGSDTFIMARCALYILLAVSNIIMLKMKGSQKSCMLFMAFEYLITYTLLVFSNGVAVMTMAFPALIGFMLYLNSTLVGLGCICTFIVCVIKYFQVNATGDVVLANFASLITMGFAIAIYGSYKAIAILYRFSEMDSEVIAKEASHRAEVAVTVNGIVQKLDEDFKGIVISLEEINNAMKSADDAMNSIAGSSENTADAVNRQADMTSQIQERLESANELTLSARATTEQLKKVVDNGKNLADSLQEQSDLVDQNILKISDTVRELVENVQKVSGITDSILNISSQTNLLALNASIEAARAGEAGRGFAVVAEEIRKLAEETKVSTEQITEIINQLTRVTKETQKGIEVSAGAIDIQRRYVEEVNGSFTEVEGGMIGLNTGVRMMSDEVESVLEANKQIVDSISLLSASSEEVSAGTQTCQTTINIAFKNLDTFSETVDSTFEQLQTLKKTAQV